MSCLGPNYLIATKPPWSRRQSICNDITSYLNRNLNENDTIYIPILKKYVLITELDNEFKMLKKAIVLQYDYRRHTNKLTKHWFDAGQNNPFVKAIRIFIDSSGWVPDYTNSMLENQFADFKFPAGER